MASIFCRYLDGTTKICNRLKYTPKPTSTNYKQYDAFSDIKVNGVSIGLVTEYPVNSNDIVEFVLAYNLINGDAFNECYGLEYVYVGEGTTVIEGNAFNNCYNLDTIVLPSTLTKIGGAWYSLDTLEVSWNVFWNCHRLKQIYSKNTIAPEVYSYRFQGVAEGGTLYYPTGSDYSSWLSTEYDNLYSEYNLENYGWNGVQMNPEDMPDNPDDPDNPDIPTDPDNPDEPDTPIDPDAPSINLEYDNIKAPQGGMNTTIDVETENVDDMQVIAPDWVDVIEKDGYYEIIIKPNEDGSDRTGEVIFIGNPSRPNRVQQNVIINQNSDNSEMAASISLEKNRITFDNTGYAESFGVKVTYTNAQEIYAPVCNADWVTITELLPPQGGNTGGDTNATVKRYGFEVTETDVARTATVTFSCKGDTDRVIANSSFIIVQMGESAEETGVIVKAFMGAGSVNYDGSSTGISIDYLSCGYSNFASVLAPIVDVDWIHLGEGVLQSGYGYDEIYRYPISFDTNEGELRVGTVRFVATDEMGDEYTDTCTITQLAKPDEPETPEIPVEGDDYCGPIWKDIEYDFGSIDQIDYSVYKVEKQRVINTWVNVDVLIFKGRTCKRPTDVGNKILVNKICQNYMEPPFLGKGDIGANGGYGVFKLKTEDGSTTYRTYRFVNDWSYSTDFRTGALSHPILKDRKVAKNQLLPFTVFGNAEKVGVPYGIKYQEGYTDKYGKEVPDWNNTSYVINNVATEVFPNGDRGKGAKSYYIGDTEWEVVDDCTEYVLYYVNPWGGYDWFPIRAKIEEKDSITAYTYIQNYNNQTWEFGKRRYLSEITKRYTLHTQWMSEDESSRMWYLLQSNVIYLHNLKTNEIQPVVLTNTEQQHKKRLRGSRISYTIEVELSQHRERI